MNRYDVTPLTGASYAEFKDELNRIIAHPERSFALVENAEEAIIRAVLGAMSHGGDMFGEPIERLSEYELHVVYRAVRDASDSLPATRGVAEVRLEAARYEELVRKYALGSDPLAAFSGPDIPRVLSKAAGLDLLSEPAPNDVVGYLVIEHDDD